MSSVEIEKLLAQTSLPEQAIDPIRAKLFTLLDLTKQHNSRVAQVKAAKASDPNNMENVDAAWKLNSEGDSEIEELEPKFQAIVAEYENLLAQLRECGKKQIKPPLSADEVKATRKVINDSMPSLEKARGEAETMASIVNGMLPEGSPNVMSFIPDAESMRGGGATGGRKSQKSEYLAYMTRVSDILVDGVSTNRDGKGKFNFAASVLSDKMGADKFPQNTVDPEALEEAYYASLDLPVRKKTDLPESHTFDFKFNKVVGSKDESTTTEEVTFKVTVIPPASKAKSDTETDDKSEEVKGEKVDSAEASSTEAKPAPAKKAAPKPTK